MSDLVAVLLFVGVVFYAVFGGADFGAGFWDLTAGGRRAGPCWPSGGPRPPRRRRAAVRPPPRPRPPLRGRVGGDRGAALLLLGRVAPRLLRVLAVVAVAAVVAGWGGVQYPYLLGTHLSLAEAAAPRPTPLSLVVVFGLAVVLCLPSLGLLYLLQQRGELKEA